jgi:hypothetical protein
VGRKGAIARQLDGYVEVAYRKEAVMVPLLVLLLILVVFGSLGFVAHVLWFVLIAALLLWALGFVIGSAEAGLGSGRRHWYGR